MHTKYMYIQENQITHLKLQQNTHSVMIWVIGVHQWNICTLDLDLGPNSPKICWDLFWTTLHHSWKFHANRCNFPLFDLDLWPWPWPKLTQNLMGSILDHPASFLKISCQSVQFSIIWPWPLTLTLTLIDPKFNGIYSGPLCIFPENFMQIGAVVLP